MGSDPPRRTLSRIPATFQFALPRGERLHLYRGRFTAHRFNSRSRVGSDPRPPSTNSNPRGFNSRSRVGSDTFHPWRCDDDKRFNSRSRVGSDLQSALLPYPTQCFNSRSRVGSDTVMTPWKTTARQFQFALPRGERRGSFVFSDIMVRFNSRSRVGSDIADWVGALFGRVSIRAPAWGATTLKK